MRRSGGLRFLASAALTLALVLPAGAQQLPQDFVSKDIGDVGVPGSAAFDAATGKWTIKGAGLYENSDTSEAFHFAHRVVQGDGSIVARIVEQVQENGTGPKCGPMIRATDSAGSSYFALIMTTSTIALQHRDEPDGSSQRLSGQSERTFPSAFLRLQRVGNEVAGFTSTDARLWKPIEEPPHTLSDLGESALFGLAVSARDNTQLTTVIFDNVAVLPGQVSVAGLKATTSGTGTLIEWNAAKGATGYNIYSGAAGSEFAAMKKLNSALQTTASFMDPSSANAAAGTVAFAVSAIFTGADGQPVEGPILLAP